LAQAGADQDGRRGVRKLGGCVLQLIGRVRKAHDQFHILADHETPFRQALPQRLDQRRGIVWRAGRQHADLRRCAASLRHRIRAR